MAKGRRRSYLSTPSQRTRLWDRKMRGDVYAEYLKATKPMALEKVGYYQAAYQHVLETVRQILWREGVEAHLLQEYMWYALELWQLTQRYKSKALQLESEATYLKYAYRGRNRNILRAIASAMGIRMRSDSEILERLGVAPVGAPVGLAVLNSGYTEEPVTTTTKSPHHAVAPDPDYDYIAYVEGVRVTGSNPSGSGVTLYFDVVALLDDESEVSLSGEVAVEEGTTYDDWLRWMLDAVPSGRSITQIILYAYCSATPASGYEPTLALARVTGIQAKSG